MISIDTVWARIKALEGQIFRQIRGKTYTYTIVGAAEVPDGIIQNLPKTQFEKALGLLPLENTGESV